jgi:hypothetical protein
MPGVINEIRDWYRMYKVIDGKGENSYAHKGYACVRARVCTFHRLLF